MHALLVIVSAALSPMRLQASPHIDGVLDDQVWQTVPAADPFVQSFPHDGAPATDPTHLKVAYDDTNVNFAIARHRHWRPPAGKLRRVDVRRPRGRAERDHRRSLGVRPGSTAFLVCSHAQTPTAGMGFEPTALVHGPTADALLFKLSWAWLR